MSPDRSHLRIREDHFAASATATYWQCRRRSHPVQCMGGVCAMCLTEQLTTIARSCAEAGGYRAHLPQPTDLLGLQARLAGTYAHSIGSKDNHDISMSKPARMFARGGENDDGGMQEMSARNSSAGSEQSIASLIEREIDQGRQRYSDVTAGWAKELAMPESSNDRLAPAYTNAQLARSRSYSANSHDSLSTPASYSKSKSSVLPNRRACNYNFRRCNTVRAEIQSNGPVPLLTKSRSTGSKPYGHANMRPLCSPVVHHHRQHHVCNLSKLWQKKFSQMDRRQSADASSAQTQDPSSPLVVRADDSVPFIKMSRSRSISTGAKENLKSICDQIRCMGIIKWLTSAPFHLLHRSPPGKPSFGPESNASMVTGSHACRPKPLFFSDVTGVDVHKARGSLCKSTEGADIAGAGAAISTCTPHVEFAQALYNSGNACTSMPRMQPTHQEDCQSIAALVSMDAHLVHHEV